jgi:hypothetical protein
MLRQVRARLNEITMMRKWIVGCIVFIITTGFLPHGGDPFPYIRNNSFERGEEVHFKMTYGFFTIGKGHTVIAPSYYKINNRDCFKVDVYGKTVGMVDWVADIDDQWGAYIDTSALVPHQFYRKIREGRYKKDEWTNFDQPNRKIEVKSLNHKTGKMKDPKVYDAPAQVRDMIGGFLYLRVMDFSTLKINDTVNVKGFFEDEFYELKIVYKGKENIKLKVGRVGALKFVPVMPKNKVFDGENSITAWFSDDKNRIPLKIDAKMFIGSAGVEMVSYKNLKHPLNIVK